MSRLPGSGDNLDMMYPMRFTEQEDRLIFESIRQGGDLWCDQHRQRARNCQAQHAQYDDEVDTLWS